MVKKREIPDPKSLFDGLVGGPMKEQMQQVWLAGLGALAKAQEEGGRVFETLVKEGAELQRHQPAAARFAEVAARMSEVATEAGARAAPAWDRLETMFEERVAKALARLGTPTAADLAALQRQVDQLTAQKAKKPATETAVKTSTTRKRS